MSKIKIILVLMTMLLIAACAGYFDYHIWSLKHPDAPVWTYLFE
jgi:hypothetical protein